MKLTTEQSAALVRLELWCKATAEDVVKVRQLPTDPEFQPFMQELVRVADLMTQVGLMPPPRD